MLGTREPEIYGVATLADIEVMCRAHARALEVDLEFRQENGEGALIEAVHAAAGAGRAVIINPAGFGHTSVALHDALKLISAPLIEVHLSNPAAREEFRHVSLTAPLARAVISGAGAFGYLLAMDAAHHFTREQDRS